MTSESLLPIKLYIHSTNDIILYKFRLILQRTHDGNFCTIDPEKLKLVLNSPISPLVTHPNCLDKTMKALLRYSNIETLEHYLTNIPHNGELTNDIIFNFALAIQSEDNRMWKHICDKIITKNSDIVRCIQCICYRPNDELFDMFIVFSKYIDLVNILPKLPNTTSQLDLCVEKLVDGNSYQTLKYLLSVYDEAKLEGKFYSVSVITAIFRLRYEFIDLLFQHKEKYNIEPIMIDYIPDRNELNSIEKCRYLHQLHIDDKIYFGNDSVEWFIDGRIVRRDHSVAIYLVTAFPQYIDKLREVASGPTLDCINEIELDNNYLLNLQL